ncbi:hypothetical protein B566_EDAN005083 [Ephemera danica]|nr:hypothetical protein B566_EDAN005083 [Ephemera danica]
MDQEHMEQRLAQFGQQHLLAFQAQLSPQELADLKMDIHDIRLEEVTSYFRRTIDSVNEDDEKLDDRLQPVPNEVYGSIVRTSPEKLKQYESVGLQEIANSHVGVLLLAGGQGTRLGVPYPKGMYNVGLPSRKTLYQLQAERIRRLETLSAERAGTKGCIPWYIMTSEHTKEPTLDFFAKHKYFGLKKENLIVFEQGMLPCFTFDGKIILETTNKISKAPAVGVVCKVDGKYQVVEYSEITLKTAQKRNEDGRLTFSAGNICNHFFTTQFLRNIIDNEEGSLKHHVAKKKIPTVDELGNAVQPTKPNGIKMEKFVFDVFQFSKKFVVWEVLREDEFSPLKNADGAEKDTPTTARQDLYNLHERYVREAGGHFVDEEGLPIPSLNGLNGISNGFSNGITNGSLHETNNNDIDKTGLKRPANLVCEISPIVSYAGEGLRDLVAGKKLHFPLILRSTEELPPQK